MLGAATGKSTQPTALFFFFKVLSMRMRYAISLYETQSNRFIGPQWLLCQGLRVRYSPPDSPSLHRQCSPVTPNPSKNHIALVSYQMLLGAHIVASSAVCLRRKATFRPSDLLSRRKWVRTDDQCERRHFLATQSVPCTGYLAWPVYAFVLTTTIELQKPPISQMTEPQVFWADMKTLPQRMTDRALGRPEVCKRGCVE